MSYETLDELLYMGLEYQYGRNNTPINYKKAIEYAPYFGPFWGDLASAYENQSKKKDAIDAISSFSPSRCIGIFFNFA